MAVTERQAQDISALAALSWVWMSLAGENRPAAQTSVLRTFQQQYNARMPSLRAGVEARRAAGGRDLYPLTNLAVDGRYGLATGKAIVNATMLASGDVPWFSSLSARYDDNMFAMIWDEIQRANPVGSSTMVARYLWHMLRNTIGVPDEQMGQVAINSLVVGDQARANASYVLPAGATKAGQVAAVGVNMKEELTGGDSMLVDSAGEHSFESATVYGQRQAQGTRYVWVALVAAGAVGVLVFAAYRGKR